MATQANVRARHDGWAAMNTATGKMFTPCRSQSRAISEAVQMETGADPDVMSDTYRRRIWRGMRRNGWIVDRVVTHTGQQVAAERWALVRARSALQRSGMRAAEGMDIPRLMRDLDALLS